MGWFETFQEEIYTSEVEKWFRSPIIGSAGFFRAEVADKLNDASDRLAGIHPLRGFDATHLASAVLLRERLPEDFLFACFDQRLAQARA